MKTTTRGSVWPSCELDRALLLRGTAGRLRRAAELRREGAIWSPSLRGWIDPAPRRGEGGGRGWL